MLPEQGPDTPTEPAPPCPALDPNHEPVTAGLQLDDAGSLLQARRNCKRIFTREPEQRITVTELRARIQACSVLTIPAVAPVTLHVPEVSPVATPEFIHHPIEYPSAGAENEWEPDPEVLVLVLQHAAEAPLGTALTGRLQQPAYDRNLLQPA
ncbi:hypothetical protein BN1723_012243 [Verticillium longisporum]|uniref:Uncharacterized protein n=1 Tax=Verticillium longisporum TaxID=100787 RepID=A0A0G4LG77_VERLO|nr:hypothetical protein BN1723_012243 [Verticillium longisporum]